MADQLLTKKKQAWVDQFKPTAAIKGTPLNPNAALQIRYSRQLTALVRQMADQTRRELVRFFKSDAAKEYFAMDADVSSQARILTNQLEKKFNQLFAHKSRGLAEDMVKQADKTSATALHESLKELSGGLSVKTKVLSGPMKSIMKASVVENVGLIRSISEQYLQGVQGAVMRSITTGNGLQDLIPYLDRHKGITLRRANNIALDQTRKAYNSINKARMQKVGIEKFEWLHTGGSQEPRQHHIALSGKIFSFNDLPVIDPKTGQRGKPGDLPNCGCRMIPVVEFDHGEPDG